MTSQTTIARSVLCSGTGLHSGRKAEIELLPASADSGIVFIVQTEDGEQQIALSPYNVKSTSLATSIGNDKAIVHTVEHLMAAVFGMGIDNIIIRAKGNELPIMDGSAGPHVFLLRQAGIKKLSAPKRVLAVAKTFEHSHDEKYIRAEPFNGFQVEYSIDFDHPLIGKQSFTFDLTPESFVNEIARARTFGFIKEVELLHKNGLALGGNLDNAVVLDDFGVVNSEGLRYDNEFVRHKILDFIGDMALAPLPLQGKFTVYCSGHAFNNDFLRLLVENKATCLEYRILSEKKGKAPALCPEYAPGIVSGQQTV